MILFLYLLIQPPSPKIKIPQNSNLNLSLGGLTFGIDAEGNYGYIKAGADTVTPFNKMVVYYNLGVKNFTPTYESSSVKYNNNNIFVGITSTKFKC